MTTTITLILTMGGWIIAGVLGIVGFFDRGKRERRKEDDDVASNLIKNLQVTADVQEKKIIKMQEEMEAHGKERDKEVQALREELKHLSGRNSMLEDLFKGRDPQMQAFLKDVPILMEITKKDHELIEQGSQALTVLVETMTKFLESYKPVEQLK